MAKCTEARKAECKSQGLVCNPKTGKCKKSETQKRKEKKAGRAAPVPSTTDLAAGVLGVVGSETAASLVTKPKSDKLGAGMETMVSLTRKKMRKVRGSPGLRVNWSGDGIPISAKRRSRSMGGGGHRNMRVNWSGPGLPGRHMSSRRTHSTRASHATKAHCGAPCAPTRKGTPRVRSTTPPCKCLVPHQKAARAAGICTPRRGRDGKVYETVPVLRNGRTRCVKAGGKVAKDHAGPRACPSGKTLITYTTRVPTSRRPGAPTRTVTAQRCVKAVGQHKDCPANQVIVSVRQTGQIRGRPYSKMVQRCVRKATFDKDQSRNGPKRFTLVRAGSLPVKAFRAPQKTAVAYQHGNNIGVNWSRAGVPTHIRPGGIAMSVGMTSGMSMGPRRMSSMSMGPRRMSTRML